MRVAYDASTTGGLCRWMLSSCGFSLLIIRFLYWVIPLWLPSALSVGLVWAAVEVYSKIEKKYFTKARERAYYRLYPERKDKNYFWLQLLLPLGLFLINLGIAYWLFFVYQ